MSVKGFSYSGKPPHEDMSSDGVSLGVLGYEWETVEDEMKLDTRDIFLTKKEYEDLMSIAEMEEFIKKKHITLLPPTQLNIVSSTGSIDSKTDNGWKEVLSKVSEAHPASNLASQYGKKSVKDTQVDRVIQKHRAKKAGKKV